MRNHIKSQNKTILNLSINNDNQTNSYSFDILLNENSNISNSTSFYLLIYPIPNKTNSSILKIFFKYFQIDYEFQLITHSLEIELQYPCSNNLFFNSSIV